MTKIVLKILTKENIFQLSTKNKKLNNLQTNQSSYNYRKVLINLSSVQSIDILPLEHGLRQFFRQKWIYLKRDIAIKFKTRDSSIDKDASIDYEETFHEFVRSTHVLKTYIWLKIIYNVYMTKLTQHVYNTKGIYD